MHRSRMYGVFVDAPVVDAEDAVSFWTEALGAAPVRGDEDDPFVALYGATGDPAFEVQAVDDAPRYHVDIETDDVAAETQRLGRPRRDRARPARGLGRPARARRPPAVRGTRTERA
jgi:catechol 2,3-dioxygenase-like lactoylglutathione lyase family enzyme